MSTCKLFENCYNPCKTEIEALRHENEQLKAQVTATREVLDELTSELDYAGTIDNGIEWDKHKSIAFNKALDLLNTKSMIRIPGRNL